MAKISCFKDTVITGKIVCRMLEDKWQPATAMARLIVANGDEYEIRCTGEGKDWLMAAPLNTALTGSSKKGEVMKYDPKNQKYTGIQAGVMVRSKYPLRLKIASHNFETPLPPECSFVSPSDVCQLESDSIFNIKAKVVDISALEMVGGDKKTGRRILQVEVADYNFQVILLGNAANQKVEKEAYAIIGLSLNHYMGQFDAQSTKLTWFLQISDSDVEKKPAEDSPIKKALKTSTSQRMVIREMLATTLIDTCIEVKGMLCDVTKQVSINIFF